MLLNNNLQCLNKCLVKYIILTQHKIELNNFIENDHHFNVVEFNALQNWLTKENTTT